jgi:hypothetical protein
MLDSSIDFWLFSENQDNSMLLPERFRSTANVLLWVIE